MQTPTPGQIAELTADDLDRLQESLRTLGSQVKAAEVAILREVDRRHIPLGDGMRTLEHWVIGRMDVDRSTAQSLVAVAKADSTKLDEMLVNEGVSFDRVALLAKAGEVTGVAVDASELAAAAGEFESRVDAALEQNEEFAGYVERLESGSVIEPIGGPGAADLLVSEIENFLRERD